MAVVGAFRDVHGSGVVGAASGGSSTRGTNVAHAALAISGEAAKVLERVGVPEPTGQTGGDLNLNLNGLGAAHANGAAAPSGLPMRTLTRVFDVTTERHLEFVDITEHVVRSLAEAEVRDGFAVVFSRHTTAGIRINEHEPLLLEDMARLLDEIAPTAGSYQHDDFSIRTVNLTENERVNGHSHCRSLLLGASETVPVCGGTLLLGRWQRIFLVELDGPAQREFVIQIVGA
jgi:secondary thiamine-phosphate synthase enzyme